MIRSRSECSGIRTLTPVAEGTGNMPQTGGTSEAWNESGKPDRQRPLETVLSGKSRSDHAGQ